MYLCILNGISFVYLIQASSIWPLGAYGRDIGVTLPDLLRQVIKEIPEGCRLRLGMTNPPYIMDHLEEIAEILLHPRVYSFLHVPVQSGSDPVLKEMRREYTRVQFCQVRISPKGIFCRGIVCAVYYILQLIIVMIWSRNNLQDDFSPVLALQFLLLFCIR